MFSKEVRKGNRIAKAFPKFILIAVLLTGIGLNVGFANEPEKDNLATVYHVYTNDEYIGKISDKEKIEQLKEQKLEEAATQYEDLQLKVADLSVIPEKVFETGSEDDTVLDTLQEKMAVEAEAVGILVDGEPALYVKDMDAYRNVIRDLKLQTVTEKELNAFEKRQAYNEPLPPLKENETRVADIMMSSDIQADEGQAAPEDVLNVKKAVQLLNKGTLENKKYVVQPGDVLGKIAAAHDMTTKQLLELNPDYKADTVLQLGDELNVTKFEPFVEVEAHFESKRKEPIPFKTIKEQDKTLLKGEKKVTQKGVDGEKVVTELIRKQNGEVVGRSIQEETVTAEPTDKVLVVGTKVIASRGQVRSYGRQSVVISQAIWDHAGVGRISESILPALPTGRSKLPIMVSSLLRVQAVHTETVLLSATKMAMKRYMHICLPLMLVSDKPWHKARKSASWVPRADPPASISISKY